MIAGAAALFLKINDGVKEFLSLRTQYFNPIGTIAIYLSYCPGAATKGPFPKAAIPIQMSRRHIFLEV